MQEKLLNTLPAWLHPRYPLVAKEIRHLRLIDYRLMQLGYILRMFLRGSSVLLLIIIAIFGIAGTQLGGFILYPFTVFVVVVVIIVGELLFWRVLFSIPFQASDAILGERVRKTWETLLSTPIPRHHIILSKFSALFWNHVYALWPLLVGRCVVIGLLLVEYVTLRQSLQNIHIMLFTGLLF
ncbi:MAG: hypothetical protein CUN55_15615, partial [Phototrophicales bacterium]